MPKQSDARNIHPLGNPHYWLDPENGRRIPAALSAKLSEVLPGDATYFENRLRGFSERLSSAEGVWKGEMRPYTGRRVVTYHRSWSNLLKCFGLVSAGEIEPSPGIPPSKRHTRELIGRMKNEKVRVIIVEPFFEAATPMAIARETGAQIVIIPSSVGGAPTIPDYFKLFDYDVALLTKAFESTH